MPVITMYSTRICPYCQMAERLLEAKGVTKIDKIFIDANPSKRDEMIEKTGCRTVPQIYIGEKHVGGFDNLSALDKTGDLDRLLSDQAH